MARLKAGNEGLMRGSDAGVVEAIPWECWLCELEAGWGGRSVEAEEVAEAAVEVVWGLMEG